MLASREALDAYAELIQRWNRAIRLVGGESLESVRDLIEDCRELRDLIPGEAMDVWDLGSGAGLPGVVLAIEVPHRRFHLVEADHRKAAFLEEVRRSLGLSNVSVRCGRIEALDRNSIDCLTARALAPLDRLLGLVVPLLAENGVAIFPKGKNVDTELASAERAWSMRVERFASRRHPEGAILRIKDLRPRDAP